MAKVITLADLTTFISDDFAEANDTEKQELAEYAFEEAFEPDTYTVIKTKDDAFTVGETVTKDEILMRTGNAV